MPRTAMLVGTSVQALPLLSASRCDQPHDSLTPSFSEVLEATALPELEHLAVFALPSFSPGTGTGHPRSFR